MTREETFKMLQEYVDFLIEKSDAQHPMWDIEKVLSGEPFKWNYIDGCMIAAILSLYEMTSNPKYLDFADKFVGWYVQEDGSVKTYSPDEYNVDNIYPFKNLFKLYEFTGKEKYRKAIDVAADQLAHMPRTKSGNFWHKNIYPNQVWLDGLFMAQPFYMEYEKKYGSLEGCLDSFNQFKNVEALMKDKKTGLYYHGYDETKTMYWANPETGCSSNFWLRAIGWFTLALVNTAEVMDSSMAEQSHYLINMLKDLADTLSRYQDESGMFYQIVDKKDDERNYLETSGTGLISYAFLKAVRLGYLPKEYEEIAIKAFDGITNRYLSRNEDGSPRLGGICLVAGLGGKTYRDGSLEYYFSEPIVENEAKGVAPLILAYTELLRRNN